MQADETALSESLLDEFPGIGANRKAALLKHFGSLQRPEGDGAETGADHAMRSMSARSMAFGCWLTPS